MNPRMLIWLALLFSTFIYLALAASMTGEPGPFEETARSTYVPVLYGLAVLFFLFGWFVVPRVIKSSAQMRMIMALAVFESCSLFGMLAAFLTKDWRMYLLPWGLTIVGFLRERPREQTV